MSNMTEKSIFCHLGTLYLGQNCRCTISIRINTKNKQYFWVPQQDAEWWSVSHLHVYILCAAALHTMPVVSPNQMWKNYQVQPI